MTASISAYTIGRGRPPLHTRFKKGQSGNPSGKPGPAKLARQRFARALYAALDGSTEELAASKPENVLAEIARKLVLDATEGRIAAVRLVLSLLDAESEKESRAEDDSREPTVDEADLLSLLQGKMQGNEKLSLEDIFGPAESEAAQTGSHPREQHPGETLPAAPAPARNKVQPFSLQQGKMQGNEKMRREQICAVPGLDGVPAAAPARPGKRAQLMMSSAAAHWTDR
ncbi:MAG TPA: DUF5681 domain-containing protein [Rhizomicrobium sp.]|nr:DUF5681 domain-containing protein [Rhizomicrobium sp.]